MDGATEVEAEEAQVFTGSEEMTPFVSFVVQELSQEKVSQHGCCGGDIVRERGRRLGRLNARLPWSAAMESRTDE